MTKRFSEYTMPKHNTNAKLNEDDISKLVDNYSTYSQDELLNEFLERSMQYKKEGKLNSTELLKLEETLLPYLSSEQQAKLKNILEMIK